MDPIRTIDAAFLLIVTVHTIVMLNRDEGRTWEHMFGRTCVAAIGFFTFAAALDRLAAISPLTIDSWVRIGLDAALAAFITARVWAPRLTPSLEYHE